MKRDDTAFSSGANYGSARFATDAEIRLHLEREGFYTGDYKGRMVTYGGGDPMPAGTAMFGGAGSGKTTSFFIQNIAGLNWKKPRKSVILDIKNGDIYKAVAPYLARLEKAGGEVRVLDPGGVLKEHRKSDRCNPLEIITMDRELQHATAEMAIGWMSTEQTPSREPFFPMASARNQHWPLLLLCEGEKTPTVSDFHMLVRSMVSDPEFFEKVYQSALRSKNYEVVRGAQAFSNQRKNGEKTFASVVETMLNHQKWMSDPRMLQAHADPTFSIVDFFKSDRDGVLIVAMPVEMLETAQRYLALLIGACVVLASRTQYLPGRRRPVFYLDEIAHLGAASYIPSLFSIYRSALDVVGGWQSVGQIRRAFGEDGLQEILSSAGQILVEGGGINDPETAEYFSRYLGDTTHLFKEPAKQTGLEHATRSAMWQMVMKGGDPFTVMAEIMHHRRQAEHFERHHRRLMTPNEILTMRPNQRLVLRRGMHPFIVEKTFFWNDPRVRGHCAPARRS